MTVAELGERMSSEEFSEWQAYYQLEPFGEEVHLLGHAIVASTLANLLQNKKKYTPKDFMPDFEKALPKSPEQMVRFAEYMAVLTGGEDRRK